MGQRNEQNENDHPPRNHPSHRSRITLPTDRTFARLNVNQIFTGWTSPNRHGNLAKMLRLPPIFHTPISPVNRVLADAL